MAGDATRHLGRSALARWLLATLSLASLLLSACGGTVIKTPALQVLHIPGVTEVTSLANVRTTGSIGDISSIAVYTSASEGERIVAVVDGKLYDVGVQSSDVRSLNIDCVAELSVTADGTQLLCYDHDYEILHVLGEQDPTPLTDVDAAVPAPIWGVAFSPDGTLLAVATSPCVIDIFDVDVSHPIAHLRAAFALPQGTVGSRDYGCELARLSWSGDDEWLAFQGSDLGSDNLFVIHVRPLLASSGTSTYQPQSIPASDVVTLGTMNTNSPAAWRHVGTSWVATFISDDETIAEVDPLTMQRTTLLHVPYPQLTSVAWTPDGRYLLFVQSQYVCTDCSWPPYPLSRLYMFQPPTS